MALLQTAGRERDIPTGQPRCWEDAEKRLKWIEGENTRDVRQVPTLQVQDLSLLFKLKSGKVTLAERIPPHESPAPQAESSCSCF